MARIEDWVVQESEKYSRLLHSTRFSSWRTFHNIEHTQNVVAACKEMIQHYGLVNEGNLILIAAWFHDVGYCVSSEDHETESMKICTDFLVALKIETENVNRINSLILSTISFHTPLTLEEQIICDSDMVHLSRRDYSQWSVRLKEEIENEKGVAISDSEWITSNIRFFKSHGYYTAYANKNWQPGKEINRNALYLP